MSIQKSEKWRFWKFSTLKNLSYQTCQVNHPFQLLIKISKSCNFWLESPFFANFFFELVYILRGNWRCLKGVWRVSGRSLKSVWKSQCFKIGKLLGRNLWGGLVVLCIKLDKVFFTVFHVAWMLQCIYFVRCWCGMSLLGMVPELTFRKKNDFFMC